MVKSTESSDGSTAGRVDWDAAAPAFDDEPDHGLRDPRVRAAWADRLRGWLPERPGDVLDLGCGTGSLSLLAAEQGHRVTGVDRSAPMLDLARTKLAGHDAEFLHGDAAAPPVGKRRFDTVLVRRTGGGRVGDRQPGRHTGGPPHRSAHATRGAHTPGAAVAGRAAVGWGGGGRAVCRGG